MDVELIQEKENKQWLLEAFNASVGSYLSEDKDLEKISSDATSLLEAVKRFEKAPTLALNRLSSKGFHYYQNTNLNANVRDLHDFVAPLLGRENWRSEAEESHANGGGRNG